MSDISILIQGPLNKISLDQVAYYKTLGSVVISHWNTDDESILYSYDLSGCIVTTHALPDRNILNGVSNHDTFVYQVCGIRYGLAAVQTPITIRTRSDERWSNLEVLIEKYRSINKIICGNIFFRKWHVYDFHIGDHIFIGETKLLYNIYDNVIVNHVNLASIHNPEKIVAMSALDVCGLERSKENFIKTFDVIDINLLSPFIAQYRHMGQTYTNSWHCDSCIRSISEL